MKDWFHMLQPRERAMIVSGCVIVALALIWSFAWMPLRNANLDINATLAEKYSLLADVSRLQPSGVLPGSAAMAASAGSLVLIVDQTHRAHGLGGTLSRNQPDGENGIRVAFQQVPFVQLVSWLGTLRRDHGIIVVTANLDGTRQLGLVNASLVLRRS